jgi:hypothetical protein
MKNNIVLTYPWHRLAGKEIGIGDQVFTWWQRSKAMMTVSLRNAERNASLARGHYATSKNNQHPAVTTAQAVFAADHQRAVAAV